jgi:two-component system, OmpR family, heavy metal sensor histidine kinase CusS
MKPLPIRGKFALWAAALAGIVVLAFAGGTFYNLYNEQLEAVDMEIAVHRGQIAGLSGAAFAEKTATDLVGLEPLLALAEFDQAGRIARRSDALSENFARSALTATTPIIARDEKGRAWRLGSFRAHQSTIVLGFLLTELHEIVQDLLVAYGLSLPIVLIVAALGGWWVAGRALAPLRELTAAAESIRADHLDRRIPKFGGEDEIRRLAEVLNAMLARLEERFQQAQRFASDASHELRTPLTIMHGEIERLLHAPNLDRTHEEKLLSLQEEIGRLDRITEHLLLLARFDAGDVRMRRETVDLSALTTAACEDAELLAAAGDLRLTTKVEPRIFVKGDDAHLRRVVLTLLDNATRYNRPGGNVHCSLIGENGRAELRVRNTGPGIPDAAKPQLFERFFRADPARVRGGHGLGLSLTREIVRAHEGTIELAGPSLPDCTEFVVTLPRSAAT